MLAIAQNTVYAYPTAPHWAAGLASWKEAAQPQTLRFFCAKNSSRSNYDGANRALARVAGASPVRLTLFILSPMISLFGDRFKSLLSREATMNTQIQNKSVQNLPIIFWQEYPVITTELLASVYETDIKNIQVNFKRNQERFVEGQHYFKLEGKQLTDFKLVSPQIPKQTKHLILWTERGTVRHAKMLGTDKAWEVQDQLEQFYFSQKSEAQLLSNPEQLTSNPYQFTLADIEALIDAKLKAQRPAIEHHSNNQARYSGEIRWTMDISVDQINAQVVKQGYRMVRI